MIATPAVRALPFAELHLHLEGSLQPELVWRFAQRNNIPFPFESLDALRSAYRCSDQDGFFNTYLTCGDVLRTEQDYEEAVNEYLSKALVQGLHHVEMAFSPQLVTDRGDDWRVAIRGLKRSLDNCEKAYGVSACLIMEFNRTLPVESATQILEEAIPYTRLNGGWIYAIGLYMEVIPAIGFDKLYDRARQLGLYCVAHAGHDDLGDVVDPARFVVEAIDKLKVDRIDHGVQSMKDPELLKRLCSMYPKIPMNTCPVSNVSCGLFDSLSHHPLKKMLDLGLLVTCNSDDPAYFRCFKDTLDACIESLALSEDDLRRLAINSFEASFLSEDRKQKFIEEVHAYQFVK
jgi:adenosine deaminase